jgi:tRNA 2-thiouridine synthesizing protein A
MAKQVIDACGLKCPQPILKVAAKAPSMTAGDVLEVTADCHTFPKDVEMWCGRMKKTLMFCRDEGGGKFRAQIQL